MNSVFKGLEAQANGFKSNLTDQANGFKSNLTDQANEGLKNITDQANEGFESTLTYKANEGLSKMANEGLSKMTNELSSEIPGLGNALSAVNTANAISAALTPVTTKEDIIKGVALILEGKITNILEEKITKVLEEKITEKVEVKVIQKLEEITKTVNDAIKTGANTNEATVGGRKSRKQKKNTRKRRINQKSFSQAFRRTRDRKRNSQ